MILPDSTIEVAARAAYEDWRESIMDGKGPTWEERSEGEQDAWWCRAQAALTAALPDLIEICAKKCTDHLVGDPANGVPLRNATAHECATAIRSLLTTPNGDSDDR